MQSAGFTPKQRMLNAYKGVFSDRYPVAPEFWYYFPAKVLGADMIEFERELPFWQSLQKVFKKYQTEGWGVVFPEIENENLSKKLKLEKIDESRFRESIEMNYCGKKFSYTKIYDRHEPSWIEKRLTDDVATLSAAIEMLLSTKNILDFEMINNAYHSVGGDYLLEVWLGTPFFDFIAEIIGFEKAVIYFATEKEEQLEAYRQRYLEYQQQFIRQICLNSPFESFAIGCSYSCSSLIGPSMWRKWDKPYIKQMAEELHRHDKLLHIHFHGRSLDTSADFAEIGIDCVCPFERGPGGDVDGIEGLRKVRELLQDKTAMNGNVHTVETLIRGTPQDVIREVREIKEAFQGSPRLVIGTGDQVGVETPEENILAMIEEGKRG